MGEHRWTISCTLDPDEAEHALREPIQALSEEGFDVIPHIETVGFFGWTLRWSEDEAIGVSVPQPGGPQQILIRSDHEDLGQRVANALTNTGPLASHEPQKKDTPDPKRGP